MSNIGLRELLQWLQWQKTDFIDTYNWVSLLASEFLQQFQTTSKGGPKANSVHFPWIQASLLVKGIRIHSFTARAIREHIKGIQYQAYFRAKHNFITKLIHCWLPTTGDRRKLIHGSEDPSCPHGPTTETNEHLHLCQPGKTESRRTNHLTKMRCTIGNYKMG